MAKRLDTAKARAEDNARAFLRGALSLAVLILMPAIFAVAASTPPVPSSAAASANAASGSLSSDVVLEQGKALYNNEQYEAALDKFMKVLRRDPQQAEAREYLHLVVDQLRHKPRGTKDSLPPASLAGMPLPADSRARMAPLTASVQEKEARQRVRQRQLLTLDLGAIPGVKVHMASKQAQVEIKTSLLFADKTGGLKEEGIPLLDRVGAWIKTFGQQQVVIHCYPEELDDSGQNGALFLHRYAQLYGFFVDERKLPASRFMGTETTKLKKNESDVSDASVVAASTETARIVIESIGGALDGEDTPLPKPSRWLEFSVLASRISFNPQEGDWSTLDLSVLTSNGVKEWQFNISPQEHSGAPIFKLEGTGNLLKRISWDGRDQKSGSFVPAGTYLAKLSATNAEDSPMSKEVTLKIQIIGDQKALLSERSKKSASAKIASKSTLKTKSKAKPVSDALPATDETPSPKPAALPVSKLPEAAVPAASTSKSEADSEAAESEPPAESADADDSSHAIWKQVIQFDTDETDLKPTLKASLERIGKTLEVYPLQKVRIMGFAEKSETNAAGLAKQRAEMVRQTLIKEYQVDANRVIVAGGRVGSSGKVEISITN